MLVFPKETTDAEFKHLFTVFMRLVARGDWEEAEAFLIGSEETLREMEPVWRGLFDVYDVMFIPDDYVDQIGVHRDLSPWDRETNPDREGYVSLPMLFASERITGLTFEIVLLKHKGDLVAEFLGVSGEAKTPPPRMIYPN